MSKKSILIFIWLAALVTFIAEKYYLNDLAGRKKLANYAERSGALLDLADSKISGLASSGQYNYLLQGQGLTSDEFRILKGIHPLIKDILVYTADFHLVAGSSDGYGEGEIRGVLEQAMKSGQDSKFVRKSGYLHAYPVRELDVIKGFIVVVLNIPVFPEEGCAYVMDISRNNFYCNDSDYLAESDREILQKTILSGAIGSEGKAILKTPEPKDFFWTFYQPRRVYFGYITNHKPVYLNIYPHVFAFSILITLIFWFIRPKTRPGKYEVYDTIIENNLKTLTEMKKGMDLLLQEPFHEKIIGIETAREKSIEGVEVTEEALDRTEDLESRSKASDFIFLDPLDSRWYKPLHKRPSLARKPPDLGKEAFSEELMTLMREVSGEIGEQPGPEGEIYPESARVIRKDPLATSLERLYNTDDMGEEVEISIEYLRNYGKSDALAVLFFNEQAGCYMIEMSTGLDPSWNNYFYLLPQDRILPVSADRSVNFVVKANDIEDPFFRKRVPPGFINRLGAMKLAPAGTSSVPVRIVLFYFNDGDFFRENSGNLDSALAGLDHKQFYNYLKETMPAFGQVYLKKQKDKINPAESYRDIYNIIKGFTVSSDKEVTILHVVFANVLEAEYRERLKNETRKILQGNERMIVNNPNHLIFLLENTGREKVESLLTHSLDGSGNQFEISQLKFPDLGKNLFAYI